LEKKSIDDSINETLSEGKIKTFDTKEELLYSEIEKYKNNIEHLKKLVAIHKKLAKEDREIQSDLSSAVLSDLVDKIKTLEKNLLTKKLELTLHKNGLENQGIVKKEDIDFSRYYPVKSKSWVKDRLSTWQKKVMSSVTKKEDKKEKKEQFKPYKKDIFLRFTYDIVGKVIPYPLNCFAISLILLPLLILPYYFILGPETLYIPDSTIGVFESTTFMMVVLLIPISLIVLKEIFKKYKQTFEDLRDVAKVSDKDYQEFISLSNWTLQSPSVIYFWIGAWIFMIVFGINFYYNPKPTDLIDDIGLIGLISGLVVYIVTSTIVISLSWYLIAIVRTIRRFTTMPLDIRPLDPDNAAGLKPLSQLSFNISLVTLLGVAGIMFALFIGGRSIYEITTLLFLFLLVLFMIVLFLLPLSNAHNVMDEQKSKILKILSAEHALAYKRIKEEIPKAGPSINEDTLTELQGIAELYDRANSMPVWPFDFRTITNLVAAMGLPLFLIFLESIIFG
jgi:hypothetical protein